MAELGINPETYRAKNEHGQMLPVFEKEPDGGVRINYYDREARPALYHKGKAAGGHHYHQIRHVPGTLNKKGDPLRYTIPAQGGTKPFLPPGLIKKYRAAEHIKTLVLTEGAFKAAKGDMHGLDIVGLPSITHYKSSASKELHDDIKRIVIDCSVQNIVWLHDGDARRISQDFPEVDPDKDLAKRPNLFYKTVWAVRTLFNDFHGLNIYYAAVKSEDVDGDPKGLDDLYMRLEELYPVKANENQAEIWADLNQSSLRCTYFHKFDVTTSIEAVRQWYSLTNAVQFYSAHRHKIGERDFVYFGTKYKWNEEKQICDVIIPKETKDYVRIGIDYFHWHAKPTPQGDDERVLSKWSKAIIMEDHGKDFCQHVQKLKDFCNVPDHVNYQPIVSGCYNIYQPFKWAEREDGEYGTIERFLKHIFGESKFTYKDRGENGAEVEISELDLGLDYLQLLYQKPTQKLPILCLVSNDRETGKSTFAKLLKEIFAQNAVYVGNSDLMNDFNSSWSSKLVIMCEEVLIDKRLVMEKIKNLATGDKVMMNSKGKDQKEMDFYGKFLFMSNNEKNFINTDKDETRFWVRKIRALTSEEKNPNLLDEMYQEIPAFLAYLDKRKIATKQETRAWFRNELIKTAALDKIIEYSQPTVEKEIRERIVQMFEYSGAKEIRMSTSDISREFFRNAKYEQKYIKESCENMGLTQYTKDGKAVTNRYSFPTVHQFLDNVEMKYKVSVIEKTNVGRPWVFVREDYISEEIQYDTDISQENELREISDTPSHQTNLNLGTNDNDDDLPF